MPQLEADCEAMPPAAGARRGKAVQGGARPCVYFDLGEFVLRMILAFADAFAPPLIC